MALELENLDETTRRSMRAEFLHDLARERLHVPTRLNADGREAWPVLLEAAIESGDDSTLAAALRGGAFVSTYELARMRSGQVKLRRVPWNAADSIAEEEFNRYYIRGVCLRALDEGLSTVEVYRAKAVNEPRAESEAKLTFLIQPERLLEDLRIHVGERTELGVPAGPNSGLSVRLQASRVPARPSIWARVMESEAG